MMHPPKWLVLTLLLPFALYSFAVMAEIGYDGIWRDGFASTGSRQILSDLVVMAVLACLWLVQDARRTGRRAAPWILLTLTAGSLGPLLYPLTAPAGAADSRR